MREENRNYSADLASMSAKIVMKEAKAIGNNSSVRTVVEALISAGVAAGIAGSSRPCSGAEHLFSHALEYVAPGKGLHGEKCGIGTIMMAKLHGLEWEMVKDALKDIGAPVKASEIGVSSDEVIKALILACSIRPERYTILNKIEMSEEKAFQLARSTGVI